MRVAVAVSGGADSTALLLLAAQTFPPEAIVALAVDHQTRPASALERRRAAMLARRLGVPFHVLQAFPKGYGHAQWRDARLSTLTGYCREAGIPLLWLGQHGDDAIETAAIRLLADGPLESLAGISSVRYLDGIRVERPLLGKTARQLRRDLMKSGTGWAEDPSNRKPVYKRAAVRATLAAMPDRRPANADRIRRIAEWRVRREQAVAAAWHLVARQTPLGAVALSRAGLACLPTGLRAQLLRRAALAVTGAPDRLRHVDFSAVASSNGSALMGGARLIRTEEQWWVCRATDAIRQAERLQPVMIWDKRCRISVSAPLPPGNWTVVPVGDRRIGAMARLGPAPVLASLPALAEAGRIVAIPHLSIWRGRYGPFWAAHLRCIWTAEAEPAIFQLVP